MLDETVDEEFLRFSQNDRDEVEDFFKKKFDWYESLFCTIDPTMTFTSDLEDGDKYSVAFDDFEVGDKMGMLYPENGPYLSFTIKKIKTGYRIEPVISFGSTEVYKTTYDRVNTNPDGDKDVPFFDLEELLNLSEEFMQKKFDDDYTIIYGLTEKTFSPTAGSRDTLCDDHTLRPLLAHYSSGVCELCSAESYCGSEIYYPPKDVRSLEDFNFEEIRTDIIGFFDELLLRKNEPN